MKKDFWEQYAIDYYKTKNTSYQKYLYSCELNFILNNCREREMILDVGCGTGILTQELSSYFKIVMGCDFSGNMLTDALVYFKKKLGGKLIASDVYNLPFHDAAFRNVVCFDVLHYIERKLEALEEIFRITDKKGIVIFDVLGKYSYRRMRYKIGKYLGLRDCRAEHYHWYTRKEIFDKFSRYGNIKNIIGLKSPILYPPFHRVHVIKNIDRILNSQLLFPSRYMIAIEVH